MSLVLEIKKYIKKGIIPFSVNIEQFLNKKNEYKKNVKWCGSWKESTLEDPKIDEKLNSVGLITGKRSGIFILDIDDVNEWNQLLDDYEKEEPNTPKVISGSGGIHYYFKYTSNLDDIPSRAGIIGEKIDSRNNGGCIFAPPSSYYSIKEKKQVSYKWAEGKSIFEMEMAEVPKWLLKLMQSTEKKTKEIEKIKNEVNKNIKPTDLLKVDLEQTKIKLNEKQLIEIIEMLDENRANNYNDWINIMFCLKCENNNENFKLFNLFSKKGKDYDPQSVKKFWAKYDASKTTHKLTYNTLLYYAKIDNPTKYEEFKKKYLTNFVDEDEIEIEDNIIINQNYLLKNKKIENDEIGNFINDYLNDDNEKILFVKSPYDTGKTTFLKSITPQYSNILFVSYRITLSENLKGNFPDFELYYNSFLEDKIICQIDSLEKLSGNKYDLIILDECESLLNHFSAGSLKNQKDTFELFCSFLINAKKIIALDGDLGNRSKKILSSFGKSKLIINNIKKDPNHFIFTPNEEFFNEDIEQAIKENKNICIVSMSESKAQQIYNTYKKDHKTILYTSSTSDSNKKLLAQVEKIWTSHQIIIYSPAVESGVDFNVEDYIDNVYVVMCSNSTSQRGLNQMIKRVRKLKNKNILVYTNNLTLQNDTYLKYYYYNVSEIKAFYSDLVGEKINFELVNGLVELKQDKNEKYNLYDVLTIYNKQEQINKNCCCFIPLFIKMITDKGHTYEITEGKGKKKKQEVNVIHDVIKNIEKLTEEQYNELIKRQKKRNLDENEKLQIKKYIYEKTFNIEFNDEETIKKYYGKLNVMSNAYRLFNEDNKYKDSKLKNTEREKKIKIIKKIMQLFKISEIKEKNITLSKKDLEDNIESFDRIIQENKILLNLNKNIKINSTNGVLGSLKTILNNYGIEIENKSIQKKINGKNTRENECLIFLDNNIKEKVNNNIFVSFMKNFNFV